MAVVEGGGGSATVHTGGIGLQGVKFNENNISEYINPPADPRLNSIIYKTGSPLKQGIIQQTDDNVVGAQKYPFACRFMFNPTTLAVNYTGLEGMANPATMTAAEQAATPIGPSQTSLEFKLLFDRTYEVAFGSGLTHDLGVYRDIAALESVVRARNNFSTTGKSVIMPMALVPCYFIFGGGGGITGLSFVGAITSMNVVYSTFSERMVPIRAAVIINVTQHIGYDVTEIRRRGGSLIERMSSQNRPRG